MMTVPLQTCAAITSQRRSREPCGTITSSQRSCQRSETPEKMRRAAISSRPEHQPQTDQAGLSDILFKRLSKLDSERQRENIPGKLIPRNHPKVRDS